MKVYTRTGDDGTTGLFYGGRTEKDGPGPTAYGTTDEVVSALGLARAEVAADSELGTMLIALQRELFTVGAELATAPENRRKLTAGDTAVTAAMVTRLEGVIDDVSGRFEPPTEFVLPGEDRVSAALDVARTTTRRAERECVRATRDGWLEPTSQVVPYLNRLADLCWTLGRWQEGQFRAARSR